MTKADPRAAFLQGGETQLQRQVFGLPVEEQATSMNLPKGRAVQFSRLPTDSRWHPENGSLKVDAILTEVGLNRLETTGRMESSGCSG